MHRIVDAINRMLDSISRSAAALAAQKDREQALSEKLHQTEKLAVLGQLASGVAHELGSPLSTLDGQAQRALRDPALSTPTRRALSSIRHEAERMTRIIRQLLDFGRCNPLDWRYLPARQPLDSVLERARDPAWAHVQVQVDYVQQLADVRIKADPIRLEQALSNLLRNALQAARSCVQIHARIHAEHVHYSFEDDGVGVAEEVRRHLFEPFFTTKPSGQGTGLGLAVAHAAARDHGGVIELAETSLGGARFVLILPLELSDE